MPRPFLGATQTLDGLNIPVTQVDLDNSVSPNVRLRAVGASMVPLYEEHSARLNAKYSVREWEAMDVTEKALVIAQRRISVALENIQADAQIKHAKRNTGRRR